MDAKLIEYAPTEKKEQENIADDKDNAGDITQKYCS